MIRSSVRLAALAALASTFAASAALAQVADAAPAPAEIVEAGVVPVAPTAAFSCGYNEVHTHLERQNCAGVHVPGVRYELLAPAR